jgi:predicted alpha/beta hydrolase
MRDDDYLELLALDIELDERHEKMLRRRFRYITTLWGNTLREGVALGYLLSPGSIDEAGGTVMRDWYRRARESHHAYLLDEPGMRRAKERRARDAREVAFAYFEGRDWLHVVRDQRARRREESAELLALVERLDAEDADE